MGNKPNIEIKIILNNYLIVAIVGTYLRCNDQWVSLILILYLLDKKKNQ